MPGCGLKGAPLNAPGEMRDENQNVPVRSVMAPLGNVPSFISYTAVGLEEVNA